MPDRRAPLPSAPELPSRAGRAHAALLTSGLLATYPILVWLGLPLGDPRLVALALLGLLVPFSIYASRGSRLERSGTLLLGSGLTVCCLIGSALSGDPRWMFLGPSAINLALLTVFGATLRRGSTPIVERFARLREPSLTEPQREWCRAWTCIWCWFFVFNGTLAALLAAFAPVAWWASYTSGISYGLIGLLLATEWLLRRQRFAHA